MSQVTGLNHVTFSVADLERAFVFYRDVLGMRPAARWWRGAHLVAGTTWICLNVEADVERRPATTYDHVAFSVESDAFEAMVARLEAAAVERWHSNRSEGASMYFLDPDGHRLEVHVGDLTSRLEALRRDPPLEFVLFPDEVPELRGQGWGAARTRAPMAESELEEQFGPIDIYLFDQLLRGRVRPGMQVLDAGCGWGRNLVYLLRSGYAVWGVDRDAEAVAQASEMARVLQGGTAAGRFEVMPVEEMRFDDASFDLVLSNAVLHFALDEAQWRAMVRELLRVLRPGGILFARMGTTIGGTYEPLGGRRYRMLSGVEWLLADAAMLEEETQAVRGELLDPLKTTVVEGQRSMTTWVVRKS